MGTSTFWNPQVLSRPVMGLLYERHLQEAQRILMELCVYYVISAKMEIKYTS
jgi:hypothetical protein